MKWTELTKTFMMISNWKKQLLSEWFMQKYISVVRAKGLKLALLTQLLALYKWTIYPYSEFTTRAILITFTYLTILSCWIFIVIYSHFLMQLPASNDEKYLLSWDIVIKLLRLINIINNYELIGFNRGKRSPISYTWLYNYMNHAQQWSDVSVSYWRCWARTKPTLFEQ